MSGVTEKSLAVEQAKQFPKMVKMNRLRFFSKTKLGNSKVQLYEVKSIDARMVETSLVGTKPMQWFSKLKSNARCGNYFVIKLQGNDYHVFINVST